MSALTDAIAKPATRLCSVAKARPQLAQIDPEAAADFDAWMVGKEASDGRTLTDISMWNGLQTLGFRVGKQTLGRHRRQAGECGCSE